MDFLKIVIVVAMSLAVAFIIVDMIINTYKAYKNREQK